MKQVVWYLRTGKLDFLDASAKATRHGGVLVRTFAPATGPGTDHQIGRLQSRRYTRTKTVAQTLDVLRAAAGRRMAH